MPKKYDARQYAETIMHLENGRMFDTPYETGCQMSDSRVDPVNGNFDAWDSDGVFCGFNIAMVIRIYDAN